jgi:hypothetical protein
LTVLFQNYLVALPKEGKMLTFSFEEGHAALPKRRREGEMA